MSTYENKCKRKTAGKVQLFIYLQFNNGKTNTFILSYKTQRRITLSDNYYAINIFLNILIMCLYVSTNLLLKD